MNKLERKTLTQLCKNEFDKILDYKEEKRKAELYSAEFNECDYECIKNKAKELKLKLDLVFKQKKETSKIK